MTSSASSPRPSVRLLHELNLGRLRWDLLRPFPVQEAGDRARGDEAVALVAELMRTSVDPAELDHTGRMPIGLLGALRERGLLNLMIDPELGGLGLSRMNTFRVVENAASWSSAVASVLAVNNGFGSGVYLPLMKEGPLRDLVRRRVAEGMIAGGADTEVIGAANQSRISKAMPVEGGSAYRITGQKVFTGNAIYADMVHVTAALATEKGEEVQLFFVESSSPGFEVAARHEFMGFKGAPIGSLRLDSVRVPADHLVSGSAVMYWDAPEVLYILNFARVLSVATISSAVAKLCLVWAKDFVGRRTIDGRNLGEYDEIQRNVAATVADVFAIESILQWALLAEERADTVLEMDAAKNVTSLACWGAIDRTMSLLGAEGFETARSKACRGVPPLPVERFMRDARGVRVTGGVDFLMDMEAAQEALSYYYQSDSESPEPACAEELKDPALPGRCGQHLREVQAQAADLRRALLKLTRDHAEAELLAKERLLVSVGGIARELLTMAVVLARAAGMSETGNPHALDIADLACTAARGRLGILWSQIRAGTEPDYARISSRCLASTELDFLLHDIIRDIPPAGVLD
jgi:alkylation response protein AidB-like acyl-CoA dehydrogenase